MTRGLLLIAVCSPCLIFAQGKSYESELYWRQQSISSIRKIEDVRERDLLWKDFLESLCQSGDPESASWDASKISDMQLRLFVHLTIARHYFGTQREADCLAELKRAEAVALKDTFRFQLVDAYLDTLRDVKSATAYAAAAGKRNPQYVAKTVVGDLADRGYFAEADKFVNWLQLRGLRKPQLYTQIVRAAVKAGDVAGAEVVISKLSERERNSMRLQLVHSLMDKKLSVEGKQVAAAITDENYRARANRVIEDAKRPPPTKPYDGVNWLQAAAREGGRGLRRDHLYGEGIRRLLEAKEFRKAESAIGAWLQNAKANPIEETTGQFGPYNQKMRMANIQAHFAKLGLARAAAGETEAAKKDLAKAKEVLLADLTSNWFMSFTTVPEMLVAYMEVGDMETVKEMVSTLPENSWNASANYIVERLFRLGDRKGALELARKAPSSRGVCEVLIKRGEVDEVRNLMQKQLLGSALQTIGNTMMATDRAETLKRWFDETESAEGRAHLSVGAYQAVVGGIEEPKTDKEKAIVVWLRSAAEEIEGASLRRSHWPNPGIYPARSLPSAVRSLTVFQKQIVRVESVVTAIVQHPAHGEIQISCYEFADPETSQRVHSGGNEVARKRVLVKGRFLIRVDAHRMSPEFREMVIQALAKRKLGV